VAHVELGAEAAVALVQLESGDGTGHGVPVDVADRRVDAPNQLGAADPQVPEIDAVDKQRHRPRAQLPRLLQRLGRAVHEAKVGHGRIISDRGSGRASR
jgi:hypothetical protein